MMTFEGIHKITIPIPFPIESVNVYLLEGSPLSLIDTGLRSEETLDALGQAFSRIGRRLEDLERIYVTHGHIDHFGMAQNLSRISGAPVFVHEADEEKVTHTFLSMYDYEPSLLALYLKEAGVPDPYYPFIKEEFLNHITSLSEPVERFECLHDGDVVECGERTLRVHHLPGHCLGQVCFEDTDEGLLFSGDHLLPEITPNPVVELQAKKDTGYRSLKTYLESLRKTRELEALHVLPGHGEIFGPPNPRIDAIIEHHNTREKELLSILNGAEKTKWQLCKALFHDLEDRELFLGLSEVEGHLDLLMEHGVVERNDAGDFPLFHCS